MNTYVNLIKLEQTIKFLTAAEHELQEFINENYAEIYTGDIESLTRSHFSITSETNQISEVYKIIKEFQ
jgi:hypothetical protein